MPANPLEDDPHREHRIRDRAYHLWIDEGRPHGRDAELWERARELVGMQDSAGAGQLPNPMTTGQDPDRAQPIEEAFLQDNLGEFPDRLSDQGEHRATPNAKRHPPIEEMQPVTPKPAKKSAATAPEKLPGKPSLKAKAIKAAEATEDVPKKAGPEKAGPEKSGPLKESPAKPKAVKKPAKAPKEKS